MWLSPNILLSAIHEWGFDQTVSAGNTVTLTAKSRKVLLTVVAGQPGKRKIIAMQSIMLSRQGSAG